MTETYVMVPLAALQDAEKMALGSGDYPTGHHVASIIAYAVPVPKAAVVEPVGDDWPLEQEVFQAYNTAKAEPAFYTAILAKLWAAYCAVEERALHPAPAELIGRAQAQIDLGRKTGADGDGRSPHNIYVIANQLLACITEATNKAEALPIGQRHHDYDVMTTIADHLRNYPAAPLSGRQCEEYVLDARDRLYGEKA